jgi:hypothetical protein
MAQSAELTVRRGIGLGDLVRSYCVLVDRRQVAQVFVGQTVSVPISPGKHVLELTIDWCSSGQHALQLKPGDHVVFDCGRVSPFAAPLAAFTRSEHYLWLRQIAGPGTPSPDSSLLAPPRNIGRTIVAGLMMASTALWLFAMLAVFAFLQLWVFADREGYYSMPDGNYARKSDGKSVSKEAVEGPRRAGFRTAVRSALFFPTVPYSVVMAVLLGVYFVLRRRSVPSSKEDPVEAILLE